jgi:hypothetical protein
MYGIIPGMVTISVKLDIFFVNTLGLPANSGMVFHAILLTAVLALAIKFSYETAESAKNATYAIAALFLAGIWVVSGSVVMNILVLAGVAALIWYVSSKDRATLNTVLTSIAVILIGYSSLAIIITPPYLIRNNIFISKHGCDY